MNNMSLSKKLKKLVSNPLHRPFMAKYIVQDNIYEINVVHYGRCSHYKTREGES